MTFTDEDLIIRVADWLGSEYSTLERLHEDDDEFPTKETHRELLARAILEFGPEHQTWIHALIDLMMENVP